MVLNIHEYVFELLVADDSVLLNVVLLHNLVQLLLSNLVTDLVHGCDDVLLSNNARTVSVKLAENSLQLVVVEELLDVEGGHQELSVVDLFVTEIVHFVDDVIDLLIWDVDVTCLDC